MDVLVCHNWSAGSAVALAKARGDHGEDTPESW
jgi:hypothetical protein